jgi:hypothetical protein
MRQPYAGIGWFQDGVEPEERGAERLWLTKRADLRPWGTASLWIPPTGAVQDRIFRCK